MKTGASVLVVGGGGREHALAWKLAQSQDISYIYVSPGNAGTEHLEHVTNIALDVKDHGKIVEWCKEKNISLVVVGPEDPLANGISNSLTEAGIPCFGPSAKAAQIEASKAFAKKFMTRHSIPTARYQAFSDSQEAASFINTADYSALVIKASGLAAGKGVIVAKDKDEACQAVNQMLQDKRFGKAGETVVVEELLEGEEVSCLAFSDGKSIVCLPAAQDHKRLRDGNQGPNTGGMGAYCPCPVVSDSDLEVIKKDILQKTVDGLREEGMPYVGVLYAGVMLTTEGPKVLEFNCRFGDPETQVLLPLMESDLYTVIKKCMEGDVSTASLQFRKDTYAVAVVTVADGYPGTYKKGMQITGLEKVKDDMKQLVFHAGTKLQDGKIVTNGGRVLSVVAMDTVLTKAATSAQQAAETVQFDGIFYRKDIGHLGIISEAGLSYKDSGVDISSGDALIDSIKPFAAATSRTGCKAELGMFGGIFDLKAAGYKDGLLVAGTDGVGTKLKVAQACGDHSTVGIDLVAMCVNDVLCHGAEPLFFLDYFGCGKLDLGVTKTVIQGVSHGCQVSGCALLGGETAEMPGMYQSGEYDLAGFAVGAVERDQYLPRQEKIVAGDVVIGLASSGIHSNGFSLVRHVVDHHSYTYDMTCPWDSTKKLGEALLCPTKIYSKTLLPVLWLSKVKAIAHITGSGLPGNLSRVLPQDASIELDASKWRVQPVFGWLAAKGGVEPMEMARTFNCGIGMALIVAAAESEAIVKQLRGAGEEVYVIGSVTKRQEGKEVVEIKNLASSLQNAYAISGKHKADSDLANGSDKRVRLTGASCTKKKVAVLISGTGTNLQSLLDHTANPDKNSAAEIALIISNKPDVQGLRRGEAAGIPCQVIKHQEYKSRVEFDDAVDKALRAADIDIVCLAGFMRILSGEFVRKWSGKLLNVHPSLLPAFKGMNAHKMVLESGVRLTGCTVHFVAEEVDAGAILVQESVPVFISDTVETLAERVKTLEHKAFPRALDLVASGKAVLDDNGKVKWNL